MIPGVNTWTHADWTPEQPYQDYARKARWPEIGGTGVQLSTPHYEAGVTYRSYLSTAGSIPVGDYDLTWDGAGALTVTPVLQGDVVDLGGGTYTLGTGNIYVEFTPNTQILLSQLAIHLYPTGTTPTSKWGASFLSDLAPFAGCFRMMDWCGPFSALQTNASEQFWGQRMEPAGTTYGGISTWTDDTGVKPDSFDVPGCQYLWLNVPLPLCEGGAAAAVQWLEDRLAYVPSGTHVLASVSNECWNDSFAQAQYLLAQALAAPVAGTSDEYQGRAVLYMRLARDLKDAVEANLTTKGCVTVVAEWQNAASGSFVFSSPVWNGSNPIVQEAYDLMVEIGHMAVGPYMDDGLTSLSQLATAMDTPLADLQTWQDICTAAGVKLHLYEFGQHVTNQDPSWQSSPEMLAAILDYVPRVAAILDDDAVACWYNLTSTWATGGSFGLGNVTGEATYKRSAVLEALGLAGPVIGTARIVNRTPYAREATWTTVLPLPLPSTTIWSNAQIASGILPVSVQGAGSNAYAKDRVQCHVQGDRYPGSVGTPKTVRVTWRGEIGAGATGTAYPHTNYSEKLVTFRAEPAQATTWAQHSTVQAGIGAAGLRFVWVYRTGERAEIYLPLATATEIEPESGVESKQVIKAYRMQGRYVPADPTSMPSCWAEVDFELGHDLQQIPFWIRFGNSRITETAAEAWHRTTAGTYVGPGQRDLNCFSNGIGVAFENIPGLVVEGESTKLQQAPLNFGPTWFVYLLKPDYGTGASASWHLQQNGDFANYVVDVGPNGNPPNTYWSRGSTSINVTGGTGDFLVGDTLLLSVFGEYRVTQNLSGPGTLHFEPGLSADLLNFRPIYPLTSDNSFHGLFNTGMKISIHGRMVFASGAEGLETTTVLAEATDPTEAMATTWIENQHAWGPYGSVPPIPRNQYIASDEQGRVQSSKQSKADWDYYTNKRHPWFAPIHSDKPNSPGTGGSNVYGVSKGWHLAASGHPDFRALRLSVAQEGARPHEYREHDLRIFNPLDRPGSGGGYTSVYIWSCKPFVRGAYTGSPVSPAIPGSHTLGMGEDEPTYKPLSDTAAEWQSYDAAHHDINWVGAFALLTGDRSARREIEVQEQILLASLWPYTEGAGTYSTRELITGIRTIASRAEGRRLQSVLWCYRVTGNPVVKSQVKQRHTATHLPYWLGANPASIAKSFGSLDEPYGYTWYLRSVWMDGMVAASLYAWWRITGEPSMLVMAQQIAYTSVRYSSRKNTFSGNKRFLAEDVLYTIDGVPGGTLLERRKYGPWNGRDHGLSAVYPDKIRITSGSFTDGGALQPGDTLWTYNWNNSENNCRPRTKNNPNPASPYIFTVKSVTAQEIVLNEQVLVTESGSQSIPRELYQADSYGNQFGKWDPTLQSWGFAAVMLSWEWARQIGDVNWETESVELINDQIPSPSARAGPYGWDLNYGSGWTDWIAVVPDPFKVRIVPGGTIFGTGFVLGTTTISGTGEAKTITPVIIYGDAALTGSASISATGSLRTTVFGTATVVGKWIPDGTRAFGAVNIAVYFGDEEGNLAGTSSLSGTGAVYTVIQGAAALQGLATISGTPKLVQPPPQLGVGALSGSASIVGTGSSAGGGPIVETKMSSAALVGSSVLGAMGYRDPEFGSATVVGGGTITASATATNVVSELVGTSTLSATATVYQTMSATLNGLATITATGQILENAEGAATLQGAASLSAVGQRYSAGAVLQGVAALATAASVLIASAIASDNVSGQSSITASGEVVALGEADLAGSSTLSALLSLVVPASAAGQGRGFMVGTGVAAEVYTQGSAALDGSSSIVGIGISPIVPASASLSGSGTITATGEFYNNLRVVPPSGFVVQGRLEPGADELLRPEGYAWAPDLRLSQDETRWELRFVGREAVSGAAASEPDVVVYSQIDDLSAQFSTSWIAPQTQQFPRSADEGLGVGPCSVIWVPPLCSLVSYYEARPGTAPTGSSGSIGAIRASASTQILGHDATWCRIGTVATATAAGEAGYLSGSTWKGGVRRPSAVWQATASQVILFTEGITTGPVSGVYRRVSPDGVNFTLSPTTPVWTPPASGAQSDLQPKVTLDPDGQTLHMMVKQGSESHHWTSLDWGLTWAANPANPLLKITTPGMPNTLPTNGLAGAMLVGYQGSFVMVFELRPNGQIGSPSLDGGIYYALATRATATS